MRQLRQGIWRKFIAVLSLLIFTLTLLPLPAPATALAAGATAGWDKDFWVVYDEAQFLAAFKDDTTTKIRLGADITLSNPGRNDGERKTYCIQLGDKKGDVIIDGTHMGRTYTLTESPDFWSIYFGCLVLSSGAKYADLRSITVQNLNYKGVNEYGIIYIWATADRLGDNYKKQDKNYCFRLTYDNVNYEGPALSVVYGDHNYAAPGGGDHNTVVVKDSALHLTAGPQPPHMNFSPTESGYFKPHHRASEAVTAQRIELEGNVRITKEDSAHRDDYDSIFLLLYNSPELRVAPGAKITIEDAAGGTRPSMDDHPNDSFAKANMVMYNNIGSTGLFGVWLTGEDARATANVIIGAGASFTYRHTNGGGGILTDGLTGENGFLNDFILERDAAVTFEARADRKAITKNGGAYFKANNVSIGEGAQWNYGLSGDLHHENDKLLSVNRLTVDKGGGLNLAALENTVGQTALAFFGQNPA
ncbi:MAG: hypothetical protein LBK98_02320, partial [Peptococcaceae bacterium]|nr:hypothetical protein [Peptococcaceae bacterium]